MRKKKFMWRAALSLLGMAFGLSAAHAAAEAASAPVPGIKSVKSKSVRPVKKAVRNPAHHKRTLHKTAAIRKRSRRGHVIQCVAFIHQATDFKVHGNARDWWARSKAKNYKHGQVPMPGAVLSFKPTRKMRLGHIALVVASLDERTILIDQAHWSSNGITRNIRVVDVSPKNDWTAVRVALLGNPSKLGSVYPTNGFIYNYPAEEGDDPDAPLAERLVVASNAAGINADSSSDPFADAGPYRALQ